MRNRVRRLREYPQLRGFAFDHISIYVNCFGRYENTELVTLRHLIEPHVGGTTALDIGANIGNHSVFFAGFFETVHAFEPDPRTYAVLALNAAERTNIVCHMFGASSKLARLTLATDCSNIGGSRVVGPNEAIDDAHESLTSIVVCPIDTVDVVARVSRIGLIKLDVEGHELNAIQGLKKTIAKHRPIITFEQHARAFRNGSSDVVDTLRDMDYTSFYSIECRESRIPRRLPGLLRVPLRALEALFLGDPQRNGRIKAVTRFKPEDYAMLVASPFSLDASIGEQG